MSDFPSSGLKRREFIKTAFVTAGSVTIGATALGSLGGCRRGGASKDGRITLTQWYHQYGEAGTKDAVTRYAAGYTKANPHINIQIVWVPGDYATKLNTALLVAGGPDVFERNSLTIPMVTAGQVAPLDDLFTPEVRADFDKGDFESFGVDGKIYAVKMVTDTQLIYYRPSLLKKAGMAPPQTLDELVAASNALVAKRRKGIFLGNDGGVGACLYPVLWSARQQLLRDNKLVFNTPRTAQAYEKFRVIVQAPTTLLGAPTDWTDPSTFIQGLAAMQWCGLWAYPQIKKEFGDDVAALPWPALDAQGTPSMPAGGWAQMVNARSPHLDEAKKYVNYLWIENQKIQTDWNLSYGFHIPPRKSVAQTAQPLREPVPATIVADLGKYGHIIPPAWSSGMNTAFTDAAVNIVKLGAPGAQEFASAASKCERELERQFRAR